jgi:hypothetical protein
MSYQSGTFYFAERGTSHVAATAVPQQLDKNGRMRTKFAASDRPADFNGGQAASQLLWPLVGKRFRGFATNLTGAVQKFP